MGKRIDTSHELLIKRTRGGVKLIKPQKKREKPTNLVSVGEALQFPMHTYFLDHNHSIQNINETAMSTCGYPSINDTIGETVRIVAQQKTVERCYYDDVKVLKTRQMNISEEHFFRIDDINFHALAFKFPWYDLNDNIIGILGFTITIDKNNPTNLAHSLALIIKTGLLSANCHGFYHNLLPGGEINGKYLSSQELKCLRLLMRGMTIKKIAKHVGLSPRTVEHYVENIKIKLDVSSREELFDKVIGQFE